MNPAKISVGDYALMGLLRIGGDLGAYSARLIG